MKKLPTRVDSMSRRRRRSLSSLIALCAIMAGCSNQAGESSAKDSMAQQSATQVLEDRGARSKAVSTPIEWFHGVAELPESHPCHDSTPVVYAQKDPEAEDFSFIFEMSTLGEMSERLKPEGRWVYFGPRAVRGVRWTDATGEYLVATCNMGGVGFTQFREREFREGWDTGGPNIESEGAQFIIGYVGEPNTVSRGALRRMRRGEDGRWVSLNETISWEYDDEGNNPEFISVAELLAAEDTDENGLPEVVAFSVRNLTASNENESQTICPEQDPKYACRFFEVNLIAREAEHELVQRVILRMDGSQVRVEEFMRPETMSAQAFATLSAVLEAHRPAAVEKATAILREAKKLADTP